MDKPSDVEIEINSSIIDALLKFHNEIAKMSKKPNNYGTEYFVYQSEIHMIDFIGRHPDLNISEISEEIGMSKSAVSQMLTKLSKKNFIVKERYKKEVSVHLTTEGMKLFKGHQQYHETQNQYSVFKNIEKYPVESKALVVDFIMDYIADLPKD